MQRSESSPTLAIRTRIVVLAVLGIVVANAAGALLFERNHALWLDELWVVLAGLGLAAVVELAVFRRH